MPATVLDADGHGPSARGSIPIVEQITVDLDEPERARLSRIATRLLADEPALCSTAPFGPNVAPGLGPWPALVLEDHSAIPLFDPDGDVAYAYRALLLAGEGDCLALRTARNLAFERYCREWLGLGEVDVLVPKATARQRSLVTCCLGDADFIEYLADRAQCHRGFNVVPYMATGAVWLLAGAVAAHSGADVRVAGPPARLARRVNDKIWFAERVTEVLGRGGLPPVYSAFSLSALARRLVALARRRNPSVAVKLPDSAGSGGNFVFEVAGLARQTPRLLPDRLREMLTKAGWRGGFPLQVTGWERPVVASPSVQLWIPAGEHGLPVVEGVFDQFLRGSTAVFAGASPSELPARWQHRLACEAVRIGFVFQVLGYFGRCSFDAILIGKDADPDQLHWVECNGRWGGVSIPMTLANRLVGDWRRRPFVVVDRTGLRLPPRSLDSVLARMGRKLFVPGAHPTGLVVLSPGRLEVGSGSEIMVLGRTSAKARAQAERIAASLEEQAAPVGIQ